MKSNNYIGPALDVVQTENQKKSIYRNRYRLMCQVFKPFGNIFDLR